jgi:GNAT superfamily N-acetyltransferase
MIMVRSVDPEGVVAGGLIAFYFSELESLLPNGFNESVNDGPALEEMRPPNGVFLAIYDDENPIGCGGLRRLSAGVGEIRWMWVASTRRGAGVGRTLLESLEMAAQGLGFHEIRLDTSRPLAAARSLYLSSGYADIASYNDDVYADYWMSKLLDPIGHTTEFSGPC